MSLIQDLRDRTRETEERATEKRANALFKFGKIQQGGDRFLIDTGSGIVASERLGGTVGVGDAVLVRSDGAESFFYS